MAQIDTLKYYKDLKAGGVSDEQAEAEIRALQSALDGLATKEDLHNALNSLENKINKKIDAVEIGLNNKIDSVETKLNTKIDAVEARLNTKIDSIEAVLNTKIDSVEAGLNAKIGVVEARLGTKIDSIKTIGWALFASWLSIGIPVFKLAFFS